MKEGGEESQESKPGVLGSRSRGWSVGSWTTQMLFPVILQHQPYPNLFQQVVLRSDLEYLHPPQEGLGCI